MTANRKPSFEWDHVYRAAIDGREYPWPVRSQLALAIGHRFFLPLAVNVMVNPEFARPIWKPRLSPNFVAVAVAEVEGERLLLRKVKSPTPATNIVIPREARHGE